MKQEKEEFTFTCQLCGKVFSRVTEPRHAKRTMFCSRECAGKAAWIRKNGERKGSKELKQAECAVCGTVFEFYAYQDSKMPRLYCSKRCKLKAAHKRWRDKQTAKRRAAKVERGARAAKVTEARIANRKVKAPVKIPAKALSKEPVKETKKVTCAGFYAPKGSSLNAYTLEDDPWKSGRLPKTVTENQLYA